MDASGAHFRGLNGSGGVLEAMRGTKQDSTAAPTAPEGQMGTLIGPGRSAGAPFKKIVELLAPNRVPKWEPKRGQEKQ